MSRRAGIPGMAYRNADFLCNCIRAKYVALCEQAEAYGIKVTVIETLRDRERQAYYVGVGASQTMRSLHLPQPPHQCALAFDLAPTEYLPLKAWNPGGEHWKTLGRLGQALGLTWGGSWRGFVDRPHFQMARCECPK